MCANPVSPEAFGIFILEEDSESCGDLKDESCGLSDCGSVTSTSLPVVNVELVPLLGGG